MYKVDENISIPHVRDITEGTVDVVKLKEALKIWSYLRETANNTELTASIDTYTAQNNLIAGNYTAITYTQEHLK